MIRYNNTGIKIKTPSGFVDFDGVICRGKRDVLVIQFDGAPDLTVTPNHLLLTIKGFTRADQLCEGDEVIGDSGTNLVTKVTISDESVEVYDLLNVADGHVYFTNGVLSHNCVFVSSDALLIDTQFLQTMKSKEPIREVKEFKFWDSIYTDNAYIVTVDPATGIGTDFSVIDVFHFPTLNQVAQMRTNTLKTPDLYLKLKWVLKGLQQKGCEAYFTIENNGIGEGLIALYQADENPPEDAIFIGDDSKREGMNTQGRSKMRSCIAFKELLEGGHVAINSADTIRELKNFVRKAGSYQAQVGANDDCVSTCLLLARVLHEISSYEEEAFDKMYRVMEDGTVYNIADRDAYENTEL